MTDLSKLVFDSRTNYQKRAEADSADLVLTSSLTAVTHTVSHSLGFVPFFIVMAELNDTSTIWSNNRVHEYTQSSNSGPANIPVQLQYWCTDDTLTINLINGSGTGDQEGETRTVYWIIYQ